MASVRDILPELGRRTQLMGVLNVTPDSFSDGGRHLDPSAALAGARRMKAAGADLIDVGGESTRPGAPAVPLDEELRRVLPVVEALVAEGLGPVSVDTNKLEVASRALDAGADLINDVSGGTFEPGIRCAVARAGGAYAIMHTRARPDVMQQGEWRYEGGVTAAVVEALDGLVSAAVSAGIPKDALLVDPGIGFGKTVDENVSLVAGLEALRALGCPILVGTSNKSFLGALTGRDVPDRGYATAASVALSIAAGADVVRVHDVLRMRDVAAVADAVRRA